MVAVSTGSTAPLSGMISACAVIVIVATLGSILTYLPMPAVAGVLALVGIGMIQIKELRLFLNTRVEGAVLIVTAAAVIFIGLSAGLVLAVLLSLVMLVAAVSKVGLAVTETDGVERIQVTGNLFYASLDVLLRHLRKDLSARTVLDLTRVPYCDSSALAMIETVKIERAAEGGRLDVMGG